MRAREIVLFPRRFKAPEVLRHWRQEVLQRFEEHLTGHGLHLTQQRRQIVEYLLGASNHMDLETIYLGLRKQHPQMGRTTVFRTVKLLEVSGLADRVVPVDGRPRFELKYHRPHHDHMICVECGRIIEFQSPQMEHFQDEAIRRRGFIALWHRHEIFGRCQSCATGKTKHEHSSQEKE